MIIKKNLLGLTDTHCHLLPYVDDGARNMDEAMAMVRLETEQGVGRIYLTPHLRKDMFERPSSEITEWFQRFQEELQNIPDAPEVYLGREYHCDALLDGLLSQKTFTEEYPILMGKGKGFLIELSDGSSLEAIISFVSRVRGKGMLPIVAHAERNPLLSSDIAMVEKVVAAGGWIQVNAGSILGEEGKERKNTAKELLKNRMVHLIGSDAHRTDVRKPNLGDCARYLKHRLSGEQYQTIFFGNPEKLM